MFKIFYSWQSDLPSSKTRAFIRSCINEAIDLAKDVEAIEAERDEATLRTTGSPDIVQTLFSKIDECDYFVADVSLCFTEDSKREKRSPNPNVMLELGYAVKTLSWNRVLCVCNTDYGNSFPFDFHNNRRTSFALEGKDKSAEKYRVVKRLFEDIRDLRNAPLRSRSGIATHILGSYDLEQKKVTSILVPLKIEEQESYILHNQELIEDSRKLVEEIREIRIETQAVDKGNIPADEPQNEMISLMTQSFINKENLVRIDAEKERENIRKWLEIEVEDEFFNCGNLKSRLQLLNGSEIYIGTEEEKLKYEKLTDLFYYLSELDMRSNYINTFSGLSFIPVAIQNISVTEDQNIRIVLHVENGVIVYPDKELICKELEGLQGYVCRDEDENDGIGIIEELFALSEDGTIHMEEKEYNIPRMKTPVMINGRLQYPGKDEHDYEDELQEYIASPEGPGYYEFEVDSLRPNECKWLSQGLLVKANEGFIIRYQIHSAHSAGDLSGELVLK